jgi:hypothetical protein
MIHVYAQESTTYGRSAICRKETGEETSAKFEGRARVAIVASNNAVVLGLEVEFQNIALLSLNLLGVELVIACGSDLDSLGAD